MSQIDPRFVKRGLWNNLDKGPVMGETITTDVQTGTLMIALLAVFTSAAMTQFWHLVTFLCHQLYADGKPADALSRQQQVLFRTLPTPSSLFADSVKLWWLWRKRTNRVLSRIMIPLILGALFSIGMIVVGIFSSFVVDSTNLEVLLSSPSCGPLDLDPATNAWKNAKKLDNYIMDISKVGRAYADDCYEGGSAVPARCGIFTKSHIPLNQERVDCPFDASICTDPGDGSLPAIQLDSDLIDLNNAFGLNLASKDRVKFRKRTACVNLQREGHTRIMNASIHAVQNQSRPLFPDEKALVIDYGARRIGNGTANETFSLNILSSNVSKLMNFGTANKWIDKDWDQWSMFDPIPQLQLNESDVAMIVLTQNAFKYGSAVDDPMFSAHRSETVNEGTFKEQTDFYPDSVFSAMACTQQYEFCFARKGDSDFCTGLVPLPGTVTAEKYPGASDVQLAAIRLMVTASAVYDIANSATRGSKIQDLSGKTGYLNSLPKDQWIQEVFGWEATAWASIQFTIADYAIGPGERDSIAGTVVRNETTVGEKQLCKVQKVRSPGGFVNINVFGLVFIFTFSVIVTALDLVLLKFLVFISKFKRALEPRIDRWIQDGVFQLQRRAYEAQGEGLWVRPEKEIPATVDGKQLRELPLETRPWHAMQSPGRNCDCAVKKFGRMQTATTLVSESGSSSDGWEKEKEKSYAELRAEEKTRDR